MEDQVTKEACGSRENEEPAVVQGQLEDVQGWHAERILEQLKQTGCWTPDTIIGEKWVSKLICPGCGKPEAYCDRRFPRQIHCNRLNNCGAVIPVAELLPNIIGDIEKDNPPTAQDPNRPATAYLLYRGLNKALSGLDYEYCPNVRNTGSGAVMFPVPLPNGTTAYNGRIFSPPKGEGKTHNQGSLDRAIWIHPGITYDPNKDTYVTEGIIDALSLIEMGYQAVAVLSAGRDPEKVDLAVTGKIVYAYDNDRAGRKGLRRCMGHHKKEHGPDSCKAIMPIHGDWNDFLLAHGPENAAAEFEKRLSEHTAEAQLALCETALKYGQLLFDVRHVTGLFEFNGRLYYSQKRQSGKAIEIAVLRVADFTVRTLHYQLDKTSPDKPVYRFNIEVRSAGGSVQVFTATAQELSSTQNLRQLFLERARALWRGERDASLDLIQRLVDKSGAPVVRQLNMTGYDPQSRCYVYRTHMIDRSGELVRPDENGFYRVSPREYVRPSHQDTVLPSAGVSAMPAVDLLFKAWGDKARASTAWFVASMFVNEIKPTLGFFPFLSFYGDPQTGKTNLTRNLNAFQCYDEEGMPMRKVNTKKGEIRTIAQRSGGCIALLEGSSGSSIQFDVDAILTLYDQGNPLQLRALKTNNLENEKIEFYGTLMFVQNVEPFRERKHKERVISLEFKTDELTPVSRQACDALKKIPANDKAAFFSEVMAHRQMIESQWRSYYLSAVEDLKAAGVSSRLQENHGLLLGMYNLLRSIFCFDHDLLPYMTMLVQRKARQCEERPETAADRFLDIVLSMQGPPKEDGQDPAEIGIDSSSFLDIKGDFVYINRTGAEQAIRGGNFALNFTGEQLGRSITEHPAFLEANRQHRFHNGENKRAYVFSWPILLADIRPDRAASQGA